MARMNIMESHIEKFRLDFTDMDERNDWLDEIHDAYELGWILKAWYGMEVRYQDKVWNSEDKAAVYIVCETDFFHKLADHMKNKFGYTINEYE